MKMTNLFPGFTRTIAKCFDWNIVTWGLFDLIRMKYIVMGVLKWRVVVSTVSLNIKKISI